jgi:hypothetical protein
LPIKKDQLDKSYWLKHISTLLGSTHEIILTVNVKSSHVLIHCSDGWDRTAQLTSISELCLDPYYRTFRGFQVLIEKEWVSFGHKFSDRSGHLSNERYFVNMSNTNAAGSAFNSVQNKLYKQSHVREISPVFHQFLDCVYQLFHQNPTRFEFNEDFLVGLHYHCYSCQFGTFLLNSDKERKEYNVTEKTYSVWDYFNSDRELYLNPLYCGEEQDRNSKEDMGVLYPDKENLKYWAKLFRREDEELNGNRDEISEEKLRLRSDNSSPKSESPSIMTDPLGVMEIGERPTNNDNGIWNTAPTISNISVSSPIGKTITDFDTDPWNEKSNNDLMIKKDIPLFEEEKETNVQDMVTNFAKSMYSNVSNVATNVATNIANKINLDIDSNSPSIIKDSNGDSGIITPKEELEESDYNNRSSTPSTPGTPGTSKIREMFTFGSNGEDNNGIITSSNSKNFPIPSLSSRKESNRNSLPSLGIRTTPPTSPHLRTNSGSSTPIYEKQEKQSSPISLLMNSNDSGSSSPKSRINGLNELEKSIMIATHTSINPSGLGLGLNFGSNGNNSSNSSNSASRSNSLGANVSLGGSDTNSRNNSPLSTPSIQNSPSILKPQDKMKELPHPLYNVDPLSSP